VFTIYSFYRLGQWSWARQFASQYASQYYGENNMYGHFEGREFDELEDHERTAHILEVNQHIFIKFLVQLIDHYGWDGMFEFFTTSATDFANGSTRSPNLQTRLDYQVVTMSNAYEMDLSALYDYWMLPPSASARAAIAHLPTEREIARIYGIWPSILSTSPLTSETVGNSYSHQFTARSRTTTSWTHVSGTLPPGLTLNTTGALSGTPSQEGTFFFTVRVQNSNGYDEKQFEMTILSLNNTVGVTGSASAQTVITPTSPIGATQLVTVTVTAPSGQRFTTAGGGTIAVTATGVTGFNLTVVADRLTATGTFTMPANTVDLVVNATFENITYMATRATASTVPAGNMAITPSGPQEAGTPMTVTITPPNGQQIVAGSIAITGVPSITLTAMGATFTMPTSNSEITVNASFENIPPTFTIATNSIAVTATELVRPIAVGGSATGVITLSNWTPTLPTGVTALVTDVTATTANITVVDGRTAPAAAVNYTGTVVLTRQGVAASPALNVTITLPDLATAPNAPTIGTATAGDGQATITFTPPANNGGSAITSYTVTSTPGGFTATGASSPLTVTGLTNGTAYTFTVTATNAVGTSVPSAASSIVEPLPHTPTVTSVIVSPSITTMQRGSTYQFIATVQGTNNPPQTVTWTIESETAVTTQITADGLLIICPTETAETITVRATSTFNTTISGISTITVIANSAFTVIFNPGEGTLRDTSDDVYVRIIEHSVAYGQTATVGAFVRASRPGYRLAGWYTRENVYCEDGENIVDFIYHTRWAPHTSVTENTTLYAKWVSLETLPNFHVGAVRPDGDGRITSADATVIARFIVGHFDHLEELPICLLAADINGDGYVDINDLILLARWLVGHNIRHLISDWDD
jgi:hypothetical protein